MKKLIVLSISLLLAGWAGAAAADDDTREHKRMEVRSRYVTWQAPAPKQPYALTGQERTGIRKSDVRPGNRTGHTRNMLRGS